MILSLSLFSLSLSLPLPSSYYSSFSVSSREVYALEQLTPTTGYSTSVPEGSGIQILAFIAPWIGYHASSRLKDSTAHKAVLSRSPRCSPQIELNCAGLASLDLFSDPLEHRYSLGECVTRRHARYNHRHAVPPRNPTVLQCISPNPTDFSGRWRNYTAPGELCRPGVPPRLSVNPMFSPTKLPGHPVDFAAATRFLSLGIRFH